MTEEDTLVSQVQNPSLHGRHPRRVRLSEQQLESVTREELARSWREQELYIEMLVMQCGNQEVELLSLRESEERMRQQQMEATHREKVLVRRLAAKEQEMQEYASQIAELKAAQAPGAAALRSALLDPAVNLLLQKLRKELQATRARLEETQNELSAWKFTPDSNTGKRLMAKCRLLYQENEELGRMISSGRLAKLEGELALQKNFSEEVKKSQSELDEFLQDLDEDVEGMQSTIYYLQQELRKAKETIGSLQQENSGLRHAAGNTAASTPRDTSGAETPLASERFEAQPVCEPFETERVSESYKTDFVSESQHNGLVEEKLGEGDDSQEWDESVTREPTPVEDQESSTIEVEDGEVAPCADISTFRHKSTEQEPAFSEELEKHSEDVDMLNEDQSLSAETEEEERHFPEERRNLPDENTVHPRKEKDLPEEESGLSEEERDLPEEETSLPEEEKDHPKEQMDFTLEKRDSTVEEREQRDVHDEEKHFSEEERDLSEEVEEVTEVEMNLRELANDLPKKEEDFPEQEEEKDFSSEEKNVHAEEMDLPEEKKDISEEERDLSEEKDYPEEVRSLHEEETDKSSNEKDLSEDESEDNKEEVSTHEEEMEEKHTSEVKEQDVPEAETNISDEEEAGTLEEKENLPEEEAPDSPQSDIYVKEQIYSVDDADNTITIVEEDSIDFNSDDTDSVKCTPEENVDEIEANSNVNVSKEIGKKDNVQTRARGKRNVPLLRSAKSRKRAYVQNSDEDSDDAPLIRKLRHK